MRGYSERVRLLAFAASLLSVSAVFSACLSTTEGEANAEDARIDAFATIDANLGDLPVPEDVGLGTDSAALEDNGGVDASPVDANLSDVSLVDGEAHDVSLPEEVTPSDVPPTPPPTLPTWFDCRRGMISGQLTPEETALCTELHSADPEQRHYGIRWIFTDEEVDPEAWIAPRLAVLNEIFAPASFTFSTQSILVIESSTIQDPALDPDRTLKELTQDTAQHLGLDSESPEVVLAALKTQLQSQGVADGVLDVMTLDATVSAKVYVSTIARARPADIHVIVTPLLNGKSGGGLSSGPGTNPTQGRVSVVYHRSAAVVSKTVLAHEMGHYFGLKHPHTKLNEKADVAPANFEEIVKKSPIPAAEQIDALKAQLGEQLQGQPPLLYPAWNGTQKGSIQPFERYRYGLSLIWLTKDYLYRSTENGPKGFKSTSLFVQVGQEGGDIFYKNFGWPGNGDNCGWNVKEEMFTCAYGTPPKNVKGTNPLLDGTIVLDEGARINVMSYIGKSYPDKDKLPDMMAFHDNAIPLLKLHANTPVRLMLRNHALEAP